jgi:Ca2+-binding RTX toxin-like protein
MSKIFIENKPVGGILGYHLYLVFQSDLGAEFVIRGGPTNDIPSLWGNIIVEAGFTGTAANDIINAGTLDDQIVSGLGNDVLAGGTGNDQLNGGTGNDSYIFTHLDDKDIITDSDGQGQIWIDGKQIGGVAKYVSAGNWTLDGYALTKAGTDLKVTIHASNDNHFSSTYRPCA